MASDPAAVATNAMRSRRINGVVYLRQDDVLRYLRDLATGWQNGSFSEVTQVAVGCVRQIADQLGKVK